MRRKLITGVTAGVLTVGGLAVAVPALADDRSPALARIQEALAGLVDDGTLTQDQADEVAETLDEAGIGGPGGRLGWGWGPGPGLDVAGEALDAVAEALGLTEEELRTALREDGATLARIAEERGVAVADVVDALVEAAQERIADAVDDGRLAQDEADDLLADLEDRIAERVDEELPARGPGAGWGPGHPGDPGD